MVEGKRNALNEGEFAVHPIIRLDSAKGRLTRVSKELTVDITLNIYEGPYYNVLDSGGHFAALEKPELYIQEIRNFFGSL